jgi:alpha-L-rhamnosidase
VAAFFLKWLEDVKDAQTEEGVFPDVAPRIIVETDGAPGWGDAGVIVPFSLYQCYGDERFLARHYSAMKKWVDFTRRANPDGIRKNRVGNNYGDWVAVGSDTSKELVGTAFYAHVADLVARSAGILGYDEDAKTYGELFQKLRQTFAASYLLEDGHLSSDTQTAYALALRFGLVPEEGRSAVLSRFVESIERNDNRLTTGFLGVRHLLPALSENGRTDVAYRLLLSEKFPSWGYEIRNGATTIWERWDGYTKEKGFQDPAMNSFNHYAFGSVGEWMYENVAGIDTSGLAEGEVVIRPQPGGGLTHAEASFESMYGTIESRWTLEGGRFELHVKVPVNLEAEVHVLGKTFRVGSGEHSFTSTRETTP